MKNIEEYTIPGMKYFGKDTVQVYQDGDVYFATFKGGSLIAISSDSLKEVKSKMWNSLELRLTSKKLTVKGTQLYKEVSEGLKFVLDKIKKDNTQPENKNQEENK